MVAGIRLSGGILVATSSVSGAAAAADEAAAVNLRLERERGAAREELGRRVRERKLVGEL